MASPPDPGAEPRAPLSRERVLRAAVAFADANGIESLTMRKLGAAVGSRGDVALQPRGQQGRPPRRDGRPRVQRDRAARRRCRLEAGHAPARDLRARRSLPSPLGDRPDGLTAQPRTGDAAPPRRRDRKPATRRLLDRHDRARVLRARQLHLRIRAAGSEPAVRRRGGERGGGQDDVRADARRTSTRTSPS